MTIITFIFFTVLVAVITLYLTRRDDHQSITGYFLAGRNLSWPLVAGSLLLTNLSTEQMVGLNGAAYIDGLAVMAWEVIAVVALVAISDCVQLVPWSGTGRPHPLHRSLP